MKLSDDILKLFESNDYLAHIPEAAQAHIKNAETLKEHSLLCLKYFDKIDRLKNIRDKVYKILQKCGCIEAELEYIWNMFRDSIFLHDIGKINPTYQYKRLNNKLFMKMSKELDREADHALLSAYIFMNEYMKETVSSKDQINKSPYIYAFAYCISRHHTYLKNANDFGDSLCKWIDNSVYKHNLNLNKPIFKQTQKLLKDVIKNEAAFYILSRLLYSLIIACDFYATSEYQNGTEIEIETSAPFKGVNDRYRSSKTYQSIENHRTNNKDKKVEISDINQLRSEMFLEAESSLLNNIDKNIFYLEAPTGSGKTNTSINLFLRIIEAASNINNVFYIFPFNTLVEQTKNVFQDYVNLKDMCVINSLTPIAKIEEESYEKAYLNYLAMNYPLVITSHVNLFSALFGTARDQVIGLHQLSNSVIILDEIQSYRIGIWSEFIILLSQYAELLNIKVIIMSATLPRLDMLLEKKTEVVHLINNPTYYYQNHFFKDRVVLDFSMADRRYSLEEIALEVLKYKDRKVLIEFIKKKTAREFYRIITQMDHGDTEAEELTGDDNIDIREKIIDKINRTEKIIIIATQVIEAGIDIDMDIGFKDISLPDSDEQFLGRINRSCRKSGSKAFFFHYDDPSSIYSKNKQSDFRLKYSIDKKEYADMFVKKEFDKIYELVLKDIKSYRNQKNAYNIISIYNDCRELDFKSVEKTMELMEPNYQIYLGYRIERADGEIVDGNAVWEEYKKLYADKEIDYAEKRIKLSGIYSRMALFTYNIISTEEAKCCGDEVGSYIYISNGEDFLEDGKFDRQRLKKYARRPFL